ncbi:DNA excision repair protein ERCC-6-like 2 [Denticeps clupeoides]|uniref:DNA excision repair protein ERCC-6-like 2 n=1 Tax=Denticeps clupeoides TaxID=299321 RepID=UPI0010A55626|nr:DNA excision repair protein ERCC-6-like 2 [Denticeps clupeoides]
MNSTVVRLAEHDGRDEDEEEEEKHPVNTPSSTTFHAHEKPFFNISQRPPGPSVPFALSDNVNIPYTINRYLRDYQREGARFIYHSYIKRRGCILGDDMGLGKTIQVISFLAAVLHKTGLWEDVEKNVPQYLLSQKPVQQNGEKKVFLIISPLSVLYNWKEELETWGYFKAVIVHGVKKEEELSRVKRGRCEIALTTYETFRLCLDQFNSINWAAVIVDEAHKIKNYKSQITKAMKQMRCKVRVGLTGTILQNNLEELYCVMDWAIPGCLGSFKQFRKTIAGPIEQGQKHSATKRALAVGRRAMQSLAKKLSCWFLRRTKTLISDQLPLKDDRVVYCSMTEFQQMVYRAVLESEDVTLMLRSGHSCSCGSKRPRKKCCFKTNTKGVLVRDLYFSYLAILRKVANHAALLQSKEGTSKKQEEYVSAICEKVFQKCPEFVERCKDAAFEAMSDPKYSGKMKVLQKLINHFVQRKDKVLLFSASSKLLDVLESYCMGAGLEYQRLDGNTKSKDRMKIVREFNSTEGINLCLVSTLAGGLGLNFVGANVVILFDPTWNPASDLQAIDRVYRIGQCRDVSVFRLISLGTVEEVMYLRQVYKQQLQSSVVGQENARRYFEAVQGTGGQAGELFGIRNLFRLQLDGTCLTHNILEREGRVEAGVMTVKTQTTGDKTQNGDQENLEKHSPEHQADLSSGQPLDLLDFSSCSEEEGEPDQARGEGSGSGRTLLQHGFSGLLLAGRRPGSRESSLSQASEMESSDLEDECGPGTHQGYSETDEGAQKKLALGSSSSPAQRMLHLKRKKVTEEKNDASDSSDEDSGSNKSEHIALKPKSSGACKKLYRNAKFTCVKSKNTEAGRVDNTATVGTIDALLGGLQEVGYTHSNQKVVGSSRAENFISKVALRDVFERNKHSQAPANLLPQSQESLSLTPIDQTDKDMSHTDKDGYHLTHPVTHITKATHHDHNSTVIIGETPSAICRRHFEDMARFCGATSLQDFAEEILKTTSKQRKVQLCQFYSQQNTHLGSLLDHVFTEPVPVKAEQRISVSTSSRAKPKSVLKQPPTESTRKQDNTHTLERPDQIDLIDNVITVYTDPLSMSLHNPGIEKPPESSIFSRHVSSVASNKIEVSIELPLHAQDPSIPERGEKGREALQGIPHQEPRIPASSVSENQSSTSPPTPHSSRSFITDLIGDTSVLDDFLRPKSRTPRSCGPSNATPLLAPLQKKSKAKSKDVWDILNEGNEESINRLTDLSQIEKICTSSSAALKKQDSALWRRNEKFLWKNK